MFQLLATINYCHQNGIVHRDLKPQNIVLEEGKQLDEFKIIDFGLSAQFVQDKSRMLERVCGTTKFIAPEVWDGKYDSKCDIWSCGIILYQLLSGHVPFQGNTSVITNKLRNYRSRPNFNYPIWRKISTNAKNFLSMLLIKDPNLRPSATEALNHPWIQFYLERT